MKTPSILIYGAGGHAKVVAGIARSAGMSVAGFLDDMNPERHGERFCNAQVLGGREQLQRMRPNVAKAIVAVGDCDARMRIANDLVKQGFKLASFVHPSAVLADEIIVGFGTVVMAGAIINPGATIGKNVIVNTGAIIEHDCVIEDGAHICPGVRLGGRVKVGSETWIGIGAIVKDRVRIGKGVIVGAGSLVLKDVADHVTVYGSPASVRN
jgi:UDP-N-acetylbacillosamine N-acetyltransferase